MAPDTIPRFYLYGEPHRAAANDFVHVESLDDRSRPSEWTIAPHSHAELVHVFLIATGGGTATVDGHGHRFAAPCLLLVPARAVHGFTWYEESTGFVLTMATAYLEALAMRDGEIGQLFATDRAIPLGEESHGEVRGWLDRLLREFAWAARGHRAAVDAAVLSILVVCLRHLDEAAAAERRRGRHEALVAKFRERLDRRFRLREPLGSHVDALGTSHTALRAACARVAGRSPTAILDDRAMLEAKRALLYTSQSIAEIGFSLGFSDPAYFSRFFTRHAGCSPTRFRREVGSAG